jgi:hypothetical protein
MRHGCHFLDELLTAYMKAENSRSFSATAHIGPRLLPSGLPL